jgi:ribonucleoside-diphosphate reductase alpha chain
LEKYGIEIDIRKDKKLSQQSLQLLKSYYLRYEETSPQEAFARASTTYCMGDLALAQRVYNYAANRWISFASPVLSNAPIVDWATYTGSTWQESVDFLKSNIKNQKLNGLPISCFLQYMGDTKEDIVSSWAEAAFLTYSGGGVGTHCKVRGTTKKSTGVVAQLHVNDALMLACKQGETRKGSLAAYLDIEHSEAMEFLYMRKPTGDVSRTNAELHHALNISDDFMHAVLENKVWEFKEPHSGRVIESYPAREVFEEVMRVSHATGEPYINFVDNARKMLPEAQKKLGLTIHGSNLCNEIHLPTNEERTAVCCLSSLVLERWEEWKDTTIVEDMITFLDNVLEFFVQAAPADLSKAIYSATRERALGLGAMGWHYYLQSKGIPMESALAIGQIHMLNGTIHSRAWAQSAELAKIRGEAPDMEGTGYRNSHLIAIAPNANSSMIAMTSPSIEPVKANAFVHRTRIGSHLIKNPYLNELLFKCAEEAEMDEIETAHFVQDQWKVIMLNNGSVQGLDYLTDYEKDVFKTAIEIDQLWLVEQACTRQKYICQGQSLNLFFPKEVDMSYLIEAHIKLWAGGGKGRYYLRTEALKEVEGVSTQIKRKKLEEDNYSECLACEG